MKPVKARSTRGRLTRSGGPCRTVLRYSAALSWRALSCCKHVTGAERRAMDANQSRTLSGQIRWYLDQREGDDLVHAAQIAADLR
jgi:hypothetical protein